MRSLLRFGLAAFLPVVLLTGIANGDPTLIAGLVPNWLGDSGAGASLREERRREEELVLKDEVVVRRVMAKRRVVDELTAGRMTLLEAAAWFGHLNRADAVPARCDAPGVREGCSEGERLCRQVLSWARADLQVYPESQARAINSRLEAELGAALARGRGTVELPEGGR